MNDLRQELAANKETQTSDYPGSDRRSRTASLNGTVSELQSQLSSQRTGNHAIDREGVRMRRAATLSRSRGKRATDAWDRRMPSSQDAINAELAGVKNAAADTATQFSSKIDGVGASVDSVKTDLASTKAVVDKTASDLQRANGDMGVMSGLIATNGKEIQELRALGDRNIYEFTITKKAGHSESGRCSDPSHEDRR